MNLIFFRIIFFCVVPVGIFILIRTIQMVKGIFNGEILAEISFNKKETEFNIVKAGTYAIWQKGKLFRRAPVDKFALKLSRITSGEDVKLAVSLFSPHVNGFDTARMEMRRFTAEPGQYRLSITDGSSISSFEKVFLQLFPGKAIDYSNYFLQVRASKPVYYLIIAIPLFILSAFCIMGGMVAGFLAPNILLDLGIPFS